MQSTTDSLPIRGARMRAPPPRVERIAEGFEPHNYNIGGEVLPVAEAHRLAACMGFSRRPDVVTASERKETCWENRLVPSQSEPTDAQLIWIGLHSGMIWAPNAENRSLCFKYAGHVTVRVYATLLGAESFDSRDGRLLETLVAKPGMPVIRTVVERSLHKGIETDAGQDRPSPRMYSETFSGKAWMDTYWNFYKQCYKLRLSDECRRVSADKKGRDALEEHTETEVKAKDKADDKGERVVEAVSEADKGEKHIDRVDGTGCGGGRAETEAIADQVEGEMPELFSFMTELGTPDMAGIEAYLIATGCRRS